MHAEQILNAVATPIIVVGLDGTALLSNPAALHALGRVASELTGQEFHGALGHSSGGGKPCDGKSCAIRATIADGTERTGPREAFTRKDGTRFAVDYVVSPLHEGAARCGVVLSFRDVTPERALEAQALQHQKQEAVGNLAAGIAHEVNTPTQYVTDNTRFLRDSFSGLHPLLEKLTPFLSAVRDGGVSRELLAEMDSLAKVADVEYLAVEIPRAIDESLAGLQRITRIVSSMKEFAHPGAEDKVPTDLNRMVENTITVARNEWKYVAEMKVELDPTVGEMSMYPAELSQALLNLIVNASHSIADAAGVEGSGLKGCITVRTRGVPGAVEVRVADTGTGIADSLRERIFDPFFTTKVVGKGSGQGLTIARSIVEKMHGGTLTFETEVGAGTTFVVRLPRDPTAEGLP